MAKKEFKKYLISELENYKEILKNTDPEDIDDGMSYIKSTNIPDDGGVNKMIEINFIFKERG